MRVRFVVHPYRSEADARVAGGGPGSAKTEAHSRRRQWMASPGPLPAQPPRPLPATQLPTCGHGALAALTACGAGAPPGSSTTTPTYDQGFHNSPTLV